MKALIIAPAFALPGGVQYVGHLMAEAISAAYGNAAAIDIVSLHDGDEPKLRTAVANWDGASGRRGRCVAAIRRAMRRRPDVVLVNHLNLLPLLSVASLGLQVGPAGLVVHGIEAWRPLSRLRQIGLRRITSVIYVSEFTRQRSREMNPIFTKIPAQVCHHALLPNQQISGRSSFSTTSAPFVLMIGRMSAGERYKGYEEMIRAWPAVRRQRPQLELVLVGGGDDRPRLEALAQGIPGVRFAGQVNDAERDRLVEECVAFALPSRGEGFGLVYLEAMKAGKPVIAGLHDAGAEVMIDGVTGRGVDAADLDSVVSAVIEVSSEIGAAMGIEGRKRYSDNFTFTSYTERFHRAIEEIGHPHRQP